MKARLFLMVFAGWGSAFAESWPLPPVIDNATYPAAPVPNTTPSASTKTLYEMMGRLEQLQVEVQQLTGKVEEQNFQINELKKRQNTMYSDFDERMQSIENKAAGAGQTDVENPEPPAEPAASESEKTSVNPAPAAEPPVPAAAAPAPAKPAAQPKPEPVQVAGDEKQDYQHAYDALRNGHTSQSIAEFDAFLAKYPAGGLANNAQYWQGEAYRVNQDVESARKAFNKVIDNYPGGAKVPDALLKLGYIELEQKNTAKARQYLTRVTTEYPGTAAAHLASKKLLSIEDANH